MSLVRTSRIGLCIAIACAACAVQVPFAEDLLFSTDRAQLPRATDCERCHGAVYREWQESGHSHAWTSETFTGLTAGYRAEACLECHAPGPLGEEGGIALREDHRSEGVTCVTCHLSTAPKEGRLAMRGPHARTTVIDVHPIVEDPLFLRPELCGTCHEKVLDQWRESPEPQDGSERSPCQECHMPAVRRKVETYDPARPYSGVIVALGQEVDGRRHRFAVPDEPWEDIELEASTPSPESGVRVTIHNLIPHAIPTGGFGVREARIRVSWPGGEAIERLRADLDQGIAAGETRAFHFPDVPAGARWTAVLERRSGEGVWKRIAPAPQGSDR